MSEEEYPSCGEGLRSSSAVVSPLSRKEDDEKKEEEERNDTNNITKTKPIPVDFASMRKSLRPTNNNYNKLGSVSGEDIGMMMANNASNGSNSLGESPTTRLDYLNQATFDLNKSKRVVSGNNNANNNNNNDNNNNNNAISSNANEGKPPKHDAFGNGGGEQSTMFAENSAVARVALDAHAARAPSPAEGMDSKLLRVRSMVTLDGAEPDLAAMGGGRRDE